MLEAFGNIWDQEADAIVITTNGVVKKNGGAVMGRGIALEAKTKYPDLPLLLGTHLKTWGNTVGWFQQGFTPTIITFPVKPAWGQDRYGNWVTGWKAKADLGLIKQSAERLKLSVSLNMLRCYGSGPVIIMPRPGCGNGGLKWEDVKPIIEPILDDHFIVMHNG